MSPLVRLAGLLATIALGCTWGGSAVTPRLQGRLLLDGAPAAGVEVALLERGPEGCPVGRSSARTPADGTFTLGGVTWEGCERKSGRSWVVAVLLGIAAVDCGYEGTLEIRSGADPPFQIELARWAPGCPGTWQVTCWLEERRCDSDRITHSPEGRG